MPSLMMTPPAKKPTPVTMFAMIWKLFSTPNDGAIVAKSAAPTVTSELVCRPAARCRSCRSNPIANPSNVPTISRTIISSLLRMWDAVWIGRFMGRA